MGRIQEIIFLVFGQLAVGGVFLMALPVLDTVGIWFFRINGLVFLITVILGIALFPVAFSDWAAMLLQFDIIGITFLLFIAFILLLFVYNLRLWFHHPYHSRILLFSASLLGGIAVLLSAGHYLPQDRSLFRLLSLSAYFLNSSLLLGAGVLGMLLGHSYLTRADLSIVPLRKLARIFMVLIFIEAVFSVTSLIISAPTTRLQNAFFLRSFEGLYLWIRVLIGICGPVILAPMIVQTVKERATMSATGLLYVAMLMVILGEIFSRFFLLLDAAYL